MPRLHAGRTVLVLSILVACAGCNLAPTSGLAPPPWYARLGVGPWAGEISENPQPAVTGSIGRRIAAPWFVEFQVMHPSIELNTQQCEYDGWLLFYTLNAGGEYYLEDDVRGRWWVGGGYYHSDGLGADDDGFGATGGLALHYLLTANLWAQLGLVYYGMDTDLDSSSRRWENNGMLDFSLVFDF